MSDPISREEHEEFAKRIEDEDRRQNRRLEILEANVIEMGELTTAVAKLAVSMESMLKVQGQQEERLKTLEAQDGEKWRKLVGCVISAVAGAFAAWLLAGAAG